MSGYQLIFYNIAGIKFNRGRLTYEGHLFFHGSVENEKCGDAKSGVQGTSRLQCRPLSSLAFGDSLGNMGGARSLIENLR